MITLSDGQDLTLGPHVICFLAPSYSSREGRACEETLYPRKENMNLMEIIPLMTALSPPPTDNSNTLSSWEVVWARESVCAVLTLNTVSCAIQ